MKGFGRRYGRFSERVRKCIRAKSCQERITTLSQSCKAGRKRICKITGDRKLSARMAALGMYPGKEIEVICAENGSQCVLKVHGSTVSLDALTSEKILVESL